MTEYVYRIASASVVDGDTYDLTVTKDVDFGFYYRQQLSWHARFRLAGYDCPEIRGRTAFERAAAADAKAFAADFLNRPGLWASTEKDPDDFGRWLVDVWDEATSQHLGVELRAQGLASVWPTRWRDEYAINPT